MPSTQRYDTIKATLASLGILISETEVNGRLIAVFELREPLEASGWRASFVELPQPRTGTEVEGVRHLQFVTRTGIESFRGTFPDLEFDDRGNASTRLLEINRDGVAIRFHDKNMGAVIALEHRGSLRHKDHGDTHSAGVCAH